MVSGSGASAEGCEPLQPETCSLAELASHLGLRLGSTLETFEVGDVDYVEVLTREFNSLTPENALKLGATQPSRGTFDFSGGDAVVGFAVSEGLEIRGHSLVWAQDTYTPNWIKAISDPNELWSVVSDHVTEVMTRYMDRVDRWDVVNEPLATFGTTQSSSIFWLMGPDWIKRIFDLAHSIDPDAELWINEYGTDWVAGKHEAFLTLVKNSISSGAPIDGVGIQMHRLPGLVLDQRALERQLRDFTDLGLKVAITELDVPVAPGDSGALEWQAAEFGKVVSACLAVSGCTEITTWGLSDRDSWLDDLAIFAYPTRPLLFDENLQPKPAYFAVRTALGDAVRTRALPATGNNSGAMPFLAITFVVAGAVLVLATRRRFDFVTSKV